MWLGCEKCLPEGNFSVWMGELNGENYATHPPTSGKPTHHKSHLSDFLVWESWLILGPPRLAGPYYWHLLPSRIVEHFKCESTHPVINKELRVSGTKLPKKAKNGKLILTPLPPRFKPTVTEYKNHRTGKMGSQTHPSQNPLIIFFRHVFGGWFWWFRPV